MQWFKSTFSEQNGGNCVEAAFIPGTEQTVAVRDSKLGDNSPIHYFTRGEWDAFVAGVKAGEFDLPQI